MNELTIKGYQRISKPNARNRFADGATIYICPNKINPANPMFPPVAIRYDSEADIPAEKAFDNFINDYSFFNCFHEVGNYPAYYIKVSDTEVK